MTLNIYFLRHGQTASSRANVYCGSGSNPDLTPDGVAMAEAFAAAYSGMSWQAIYTSPLNRAVETARPISAATGIEPLIRDELAEISYGAWEEKTVATVNTEYHDDYVRWVADPAWNPPTGGETAIAIATRVLNFVDEVKRTFGGGPAHDTARDASGTTGEKVATNILAISHKATIRVALCALLGIDVGRFRFRLGCPVASLSMVEFGAHGPLLHRLADRAHLSTRLRELPGT